VLWPGLCRVIARLRDTDTAWQGQIGLVRDWYQPLLDRLYDYPASRAGDLDQLEQIAFGYASRERFLTELTLDPPDASGAEAGRPLLDEDYLILSTIHSAKGQEWDTVFILNLVDGCIPSDMATGKPEQIDEERRLLYVAMTRAREHLHLVQPRRAFIEHSNTGMVVVTSSRRDRAFCRTRSSACSRASQARSLPPPPMGTPPARLPGSTSPSGFVTCGAKADRHLPGRRAAVRDRVPARTDFCVDADRLQTTWLRSRSSPRQRRPRLSRRISITLSS
jgi:UvrD-like helicase C-terminal domain